MSQKSIKSSSVKTQKKIAIKSSSKRRIERTKLSNGSTRFDARISEDLKNLLLEAAMISNNSLTNFILEAAQEKATRILIQQETILASERDKQVFYNALINPPKPNTALKNLAKKYQTPHLAPAK